MERFGLEMIRARARGEAEGAGSPGPAAPDAEIIDATPRWRAFEADFDPSRAELIALRVVGRLENEEFACVLVVGASR